MKNGLVNLGLVLFFCSLISENSAAFDKVVGYFSSWSVYRPGDGYFDVESIDPGLYTHLTYAFVGINDDGHVVPTEHSTNAIQRFANLKHSNDQLKVLIAIGGGDETSSQIFSRVSKDPSKRRALIDNTVQFLQRYGFDGFDFDWEYPGAKGGDASDKANFATWLREFREEFNKHGFLLTAAVAGPQYQINESYDVPAINEALDFINLMAYDINGPWSMSGTGHNAPMNGVQTYVNNWISAGMDPQKIVMGVPAYGQSYTLADPGNNGVGAPMTGSGTKATPTYNEIMDYINSGTWTVKQDGAEQVPYMHRGDQWVSYDDKNSIAAKVNYAKGRGLRGTMVWSVDMDDVHGKSGEVNQIARTIRNNMN